MRNVKNYKITSWLEDQRADCAIILTGQAYRIEEGFNLLYQKQIQKLIVSGVHKNSSLKEIFPLWPFYGNLDEKNVYLEKKSKTTYGNAVQSAVVAKKMKCQSVILVTSHTHMHRAYRTFQEIFPKSITILPRSVVSGRLKPHWDEMALEALKAYFYSLWVY